METLVDFEHHKYQIEQRIPLEMRAPSHMSRREELVKVVRAQLAQAIGQFVYERVAEIDVIEDSYDNTLRIRALFYAIPPKDVPRNGKQYMPVFEALSAPQEVRYNIPRYATAELIQLYEDAFNISLMNPDDTLPPERRGLDAVFDYLRSTTPL